MQLQPKQMKATVGRASGLYGYQIAVAAGLIFFIGAIIWYLMSINRPTENFPVHRPIEIEMGSTAAEISTKLAKMEVVRSRHYLNYLLKDGSADARIQAGSYQFPAPMTSKEVAYAITHGEYLTPAVKITIPEGLRGDTMLSIIKDALPTLDIDPMMLDAHIGYLFPDTYHVTNEVSAKELIDRMRQNFDQKVGRVAISENAYGLSTEEVIILASIVEREANDPDSMRKVAGTLLNRLAIDMPLQVDAVFDYLLGKESYELTQTDLEMESDFNTYTRKGLPPHPIANPGLDAIMAVLNPIESNYLYFLTGIDGNFYYAETFDEHVENKIRYLQ